MNKWAWWNPYLPQTLQISVGIAYFSVAATILFNGIFILFNISIFIPLAIGVLGAFGIVNLRWWGYVLALLSAIFPFLFAIFLIYATSYTFSDYLADAVFGPGIISTIFQIAIVALLVHPMSTSYVKSNFEKTIP